QLDDRKVREFLGEDVPEPHLAFLMPAIGKRTGKHRDLLRLRGAEEAAEKIAGEPSGLAIVDPDIGDPRDMQDVGCACHDFGTACREAADRLAHGRMVERDHTDAAGYAAKVLERA